MLAFVFNNTIVGYRLFDISYDRMIELVIFILLFPVLMKDVQKDYKYKDIYVLFIMMIFCLILHSFIAFSQEAPYVPPTDIFRDLVRMFFFVILLMLINFSVVRNPQSINIYLIGMFVWVLFGFFQNPFTPFTGIVNDLYLTYFFDNMTQEEAEHSVREIGYGFLPRATGPFGFPVSYSYALLTTLIVAGFKYLQDKKNIYFYLSGFIYLVIMMTFTKSAVIAGGLVMLFLMICKSKTFTALTGLSVLLIALSVLPIEIILNSRVFDVFYEGSARINAFTAGFMTILEEPFYATSGTYIDNFYNACEMYGMRDCGVLISSHNGFVNITEATTIIGGLVFILLWCLLFYYSFTLPAPYRGFFAVSLVAYSIQCSLHNNMLFISEYSFILPVVLLIREAQKVKPSNKSTRTLLYS
tara:strand:- start:1083 stop:2321 length:1239 start_codon:yes stop_codon:yes gene_type:complete